MPETHTSTGIVVVVIITSSDALYSLPSAFLQRPTVEVWKHCREEGRVFREQRVYYETKEERAATLAEERRLQEFQRALEHMDPAEAEAARQAERERSLRLEEREA